MIEVKNLTKYYGEHVGIKDVTFEVKKGEILGFLGPNGAGKTTTMKILSSYMPPTSGTAKVCGYDVFEESQEVKKRVGYLPEHPPLYLDQTVNNYLLFVSEIKGVPSEKRRSAISNVIEKCGLDDVKGRLIGNLSKGYKQRVGIAQAMIHNPDVLILDEPTIGLDPKQIMEIRELIRSLGSDHTIILSTHILQEVTMLCKRVVIINKGRLVAADTYEQLSSHLAKGTKVLVKVGRPDSNLVKELKSIDGIKETSEAGDGSYIVEMEQGRDVRNKISEVIVKNNRDLLELKQLSMTLEDIYVSLIS
jgi:ABC-2 type transport system ATP-binding protein